MVLCVVGRIRLRYVELRYVERDDGVWCFKGHRCYEYGSLVLW